MPDQPNDLAPGVDVWAIQPPEHSSAAAGEAPPRRHRAARTDWRLGGRTVRRWREGTLAVALLSLGAALVLGALVDWFWDSPWAATGANLLLWVGMLVPIAWAFSRSRPVGLLRFRAIDLLYGVVLGALLRTSQGAIEGFDGSPAAFPSLTSIDGALAPTTLGFDVIAPVLVAPAIEEFFFRGVVLVSLYAVLRRPVGKATAGAVAVLISSALFVVVHGIGAGVGIAEVVSVSLLGLVCGLLVVLTGRLWGAVLVHAMYNATFVALALAGSVFAVAA